MAFALGDLVEDVVFIGGAIAALLHTTPPFDRPRPTKDVDGVTASSKYSDVEDLHERLRARGFRQDPGYTSHVHRWRSPDGDALDLVPAGQHLGGSSQVWDAVAIETSIWAEIGNVRLRHASAPAFLALKWAAHHDRGKDDPFSRHDLEDILGLFAARRSTVAEIRLAPLVVQRFLVDQARQLLDVALGDLIAAHLNNAQDPLAYSGGCERSWRSLRDSNLRLQAITELRDHGYERIA